MRARFAQRNGPEKGCPWLRDREKKEATSFCQLRLILFNFPSVRGDGGEYLLDGPIANPPPVRVVRFEFAVLLVVATPARLEAAGGHRHACIGGRWRALGRAKASLVWSYAQVGYFFSILKR